MELVKLKVSDYFSRIGALVSASLALQMAISTGGINDLTDDNEREI